MAQECVMGGQLQWDWTHLCRWNSFQTFVAAPSFQFLENPLWIRGKRNLVEEADCSAFTLLSVTDRILGRQGLELSCKDLGCVISQACNHLTIWAGNWIQLRRRKKWVKISQIHGFWANVWLAQFYTEEEEEDICQAYLHCHQRCPCRSIESPTRRTLSLLIGYRSPIFHNPDDREI